MLSVPRIGSLLELTVEWGCRQLNGCGGGSVGCCENSYVRHLGWSDFLEKKRYLRFEQCAEIAVGDEVSRERGELKVV